MRERAVSALSGFLALFALLAILALAIWGFIGAASRGEVGGIVVWLLIFAVDVVCLAGLFTVQPNEARVLMLFGAYKGTVHLAGLRWANPFYRKKRISVRTRNFETGKLKVNDSRGNPVEIGAVVVWKVVDTAEALFNVDDYVNFVRVQSEAAVRGLATNYPYDALEEGEVTLSGHTAKISQQLCTEVQERLQEAGVSVLEARISHLAYSPEIAAAMLQRQQASAVVAARAKIVEGAVGMVEHALDELSKQQILELDEERKAAMVSNLLVVLCSDKHTQPVVNTGTLHN
ncbi:MAG: SPFH domain-containing protein [Thermoanaerobaculia bacterium]